MLLAATLFGVGHAAPGLACSYHGLGNGLAPVHPRSIEVAIAIREALDRHVIEATAPLPALVQFARVGRRLEQMRQRLGDAAETRPTPPMALVLIESRLWSRYSMQDSKVSLEPHVAGPTAGDAIVLTGEPVLKALLDGSMSVERAMAEGVLVVTRPSGSNVPVEEDLRRAFDGSTAGPSGAQSLH